MLNNIIKKHKKHVVKQMVHGIMKIVRIKTNDFKRDKISLIINNNYNSLIQTYDLVLV